MNNIFILDGQTDEVLGHINKKYVIDNEHEKDLPSHKDYFRFTVLADNKYAEHLTKRNGLIVPGEDGELLEFRIFESIKYRNNEGLFIEVHALATYLDLKTQKIFDPQKTSSETALQHANSALAGTEWQVGQVDFKGTRTLTFDNPFNSYDYILRIAREFELEPRFYIKVDGNKITGRYVDLIERIGEFRGRTIEFGRDLQSIERKEDTSEVVTALWIYGPQREDGTRLKVFVEDDEARQRWGRRGQHIIDYYEPETENQDITEERLRTLGEMELKKRINAVVTYEAEILDLENVPGLENKKIRFGDTIRIKDTKFNPPLYLEARVFNVKRDVFNKAKKTVQLGDYREYTEEEVKALFRQMQEEIRRRLERLVLVSIISSAGNVFKNGEGSTELTAKTFLGGAEVDEDGTKYEYRWHKFDKNGDYEPGFYKEGKTITVNASDIDEKASFRVEIILDDEVLTVHEITLTNVFDGEDGEPGPPGPKGDKGDKGDPGPQGPPGTSITSIVEYYLATNQSFGVTTDTPGWTTTMQQMTPTNRYLWNYERINFSDGTHQNTNPVIIGVYGDEGEEGRSIVSITEYYLASSASSGVTRNTSGWTTTMQVTTPEKKYLWNYEKITWNKAPLETYTDPVIIGVHGERGPQGPQGPQGIQGPPGQDGQSQYVHIRYSANSNGNPMTTTPQSDTKYIGLAVTTSPTAPSSYTAYTWSKYRGEDGQDGIPGPPGKDGQTTYTWVKYADDENGNGMSDSPAGKKYIGLAFNKTTLEESNNPADYTWSLLHDRIIYLDGTGKIFNDVATFSSSTSSMTGYLIIETPITSPYMTKLHITGYNYVGARSDIDLNVNFYAYANNQFHQHSFTNIGNYAINNVRLGRLNGRAVVIIGESNSTWSYPKVVVEKAIISHTQPPDSYLNGWNIKISNDISSYTNIVTITNKKDIQTEIDNAISTADGKNSIFPQPTAPSTTGRKIGDVWFDTSRDNLMHRFDGQQWVEAKWGEQSIVANSITANHIKSLVGLNVNDQFIVDSNGNVKFAGSLEGATGVFSGEIKTKKLRVRADSVHDFYNFGIEIETAQWQPDLDKPFVRTGYISFNTGNNGLEIIKYNENGQQEYLDYFEVFANGFRVYGDSYFEGRLIAKNTVIIESPTYSYLRPNNPNNELRVANSKGQWSTVRAYTANPSSEKWKTDIKDVDFSAIEVLKQSKIYSYIRDGKKEREIGFIIERETPDILKDGEGVNSYSHSSLNTLAIQELIERVENIEERLERLENEGN